MDKNEAYVNWSQLDEMKENACKKILKHLPKGAQMSPEDICHVIDSTLIKLIKLYVPSLNGGSVVTYCQMFLEKMAMEAVIKASTYN